MFPIPWNFPLRKKNGNLVNIGDAIDEGSELPEHGVGDAGKVLSVDTNGDLEWSNEVPVHAEADAGKLLSVDDSGELEWSDEVPQAIQNLSNKLDDEIEARAMLGAHNLCSFNDSFTLIRGTDDTNRVKNIIINPVPTLDSYVLSFKISDASNATKINVQMGNTSSVGTAQAVTDLSTGRKTLTFTFSEEVNRLYFYLTSSDPSDATITISEVMITSPSDSSADYQPYTMTNRELTGDVMELKPIITTITPASGITLARNSVIKQGKLVHMFFKIESPAPDTSINDVVIGTTPFTPETDFVFISCYDIDRPFDIKHSAFIRKSNREIVFPLGATVAPVYAEVVYACQ